MGIFSKRKPAPSAPDAGPTFTEVNESEAAWMAGHLEFAAAQGVDVSDARQVGAFYDSLLALWSSAPEGARPDPNDLISVLGTVFGEHLVRSTSMVWRVATDSYGTELAVHDAATDALVYPTNAVVKRWTTGASGDFIPAMSADIVALAG